MTKQILRKRTAEQQSLAHHVRQLRAAVTPGDLAKVLAVCFHQRNLARKDKT